MDATAPSTIPVRKMNAYGTITVRLLNRDGTQPPAGTPELSAEQYPQTSLSDERYKLHGNHLAKKQDNLLWLSNNDPLLFEELLCFLENTNERGSKSIDSLLDHNLVPDGQSATSYVLAYYRSLIDTAPMLFELAEEGFPSPFTERIAYSLFVLTRSACGNTVEHPRHREAMLAVWIMQNTHSSIANLLPIKDHESDLDLIHERFAEVYNLRHELRQRSTIDKHVIEDLLQYTGPLRTGCL